MSDKKFNNLMCTNFECAMHVQLAEYCYLHLYYEIMKEQGFNITIEANQNLSEIQMISLFTSMRSQTMPLHTSRIFQSMLTKD